MTSLNIWKDERDPSSVVVEVKGSYKYSLSSYFKINNSNNTFNVEGPLWAYQVGSYKTPLETDIQIENFPNTKEDLETLLRQPKHVKNNDKLEEYRRRLKEYTQTGTYYFYPYPDQMVGFEPKGSNNIIYVGTWEQSSEDQVKINYAEYANNNRDKSLPAKNTALAMLSDTPARLSTLTISIPKEEKQEEEKKEEIKIEEKNPKSEVKPGPKVSVDIYIDPKNSNHIVLYSEQTKKYTLCKKENDGYSFDIFIESIKNYTKLTTVENVQSYSDWHQIIEAKENATFKEQVDGALMPAIDFDQTLPTILKFRENNEVKPVGDEFSINPSENLEEVVKQKLGLGVKEKEVKPVEVKKEEPAKSYYFFHKDGALLYGKDIKSLDIVIMGSWTAATNQDGSFKIAPDYTKPILRPALINDNEYFKVEDLSVIDEESEYEEEASLGEFVAEKNSDAEKICKLRYPVQAAPIVSVKNEEKKEEVKNEEVKRKEEKPKDQVVVYPKVSVNIYTPKHPISPHIILAVENSTHYMLCEKTARGFYIFYPFSGSLESYENPIKIDNVQSYYKWPEAIKSNENAAFKTAVDDALSAQKEEELIFVARKNIRKEEKPSANTAKIYTKEGKNPVLLDRNGDYFEIENYGNDRINLRMLSDKPEGYIENIIEIGKDEDFISAAKTNEKIKKLLPSVMKGAFHFYPTPGKEVGFHLNGSDKIVPIGKWEYKKRNSPQKMDMHTFTILPPVDIENVDLSTKKRAFRVSDQPRGSTVFNSEISEENNRRVNQALGSDKTAHNDSATKLPKMGKYYFYADNVVGFQVGNGEVQPVGTWSMTKRSVGNDDEKMEVFKFSIDRKNGVIIDQNKIKFTVVEDKPDNVNEILADVENEHAIAVVSANEKLKPAQKNSEINKIVNESLLYNLLEQLAYQISDLHATNTTPAIESRTFLIEQYKIVRGAYEKTYGKLPKNDLLSRTSAGFFWKTGTPKYNAAKQNKSSLVDRFSSIVTIISDAPEFENKEQVLERIKKKISSMSEAKKEEKKPEGAFAIMEKKVEVAEPVSSPVYKTVTQVLYNNTGASKKYSTEEKPAEFSVPAIVEKKEEKKEEVKLADPAITQLYQPKGFVIEVNNTNKQAVKLTKKEVTVNYDMPKDIFTLTVTEAKKPQAVEVLVEATHLKYQNEPVVIYHKDRKLAESISKKYEGRNSEVTIAKSYQEFLELTSEVVHEKRVNPLSTTKRHTPGRFL